MQSIIEIPVAVFDLSKWIGGRKEQKENKTVKVVRNNGGREPVSR